MSSIFSRILVGIDDSEQAQVAAVVATRLAREHHGELVLCHAVRSIAPQADPSDSDGALAAPGAHDASANRARILLDAAAESAESFGISTQQRTIAGEAAAGLIRVAEETACRLIVVGTHHGVGVQQLLIGSTTNGVLRASTLPVLTIGPHIRLAAETRRCFEQILVATDDSEPSEAAVEIALRLPLEDRRKVVFCCVADVDHRGDAASDGAEPDDQTLGNRLTAQAETIARRAQTLAHARGVRAESRVLEGKPSEALVDAAVREQLDLIILGSHGRRGIERLLLGSVAETVVRTAPVPVLVIPVAVAVGVTARKRHHPA